MSAPKKIAVAGATGRVGRHLVDILEARATRSRRSRARAAWTSSPGKVSPRPSRRVRHRRRGHRPLARGAGGHGVLHHRGPQPPGGRRAGRRAADRGRVDHRQRPLHRRLRRGEGRPRAGELSGPIPARVLRAAQFHEFVAQLMEWGARGDATYVPRMRTQLVAARTVAEALADLATASNGTQAPILEIAGPREERLVEMATLLAARRGDAAPIEERRATPATPTRAVYASGGLLPGPGRHPRRPDVRGVARRGGLSATPAARGAPRRGAPARRRSTAARSDRRRRAPASAARRRRRRAGSSPSGSAAPPGRRRTPRP